MRRGHRKKLSAAVRAEGEGEMIEGEAWYLAVLTFAAFWAAVSAAMLVGSTHGGKRGPAWFWAATFVASSLFAAYCFGRLVWGGGEGPA